MPRITSRIVALVVAAALVSVAMFAAGRDAGAASTGYAIDIKISDDVYSVACDGVDSFRITATVTLDGAPVRGAAVYAQSALAGHTNRHGVLRFDYAPPPNPMGAPRTSVFVSALAGGVTVAAQSPRFFSCPFPSGPYALSVRLFHDSDVDGVRDPNERSLKQHDVLVGFSADTLQATVPARRYQTDGVGFASAALASGGDGVRGRWTVCLTQEEVDRGLRIVSAAGATPPAIVGDCAYLPALAAGQNEFRIGVSRTSH